MKWVQLRTGSWVNLAHVARVSQPVRRGGETVQGALLFGPDGEQLGETSTLDPFAPSSDLNRVYLPAAAGTVAIVMQAHGEGRPDTVDVYRLPVVAWMMDVDVALPCFTEAVDDEAVMFEGPDGRITRPYLGWGTLDEMKAEYLAEKQQSWERRQVLDARQRDDD
jgi:hypothetical protein